ncbi:MAG TPA: hypothetical protein DEA82_06985 [Flavobacteriaceae bacterium]|nr:hypothetical protein [Flavobacteriaceae bacterium]
MPNMFLKTYHFLKSQKLLFWLGFMLLFGALGFTTSRISFEEDIAKLIPRTLQNEHLQQVLETAKFSDKVIIHVQKSENGTLEDVTDLGRAVNDSLENNFAEYIKEIQGAIEEDAALDVLDFVYEHLPLFLDENDFSIIARQLDPDSIANRTKTNYETLISPTGILAKRSIARDPLGITFLGLEQLRAFNANDAFELKHGFLVSKDEQHLLLFISPKYSSSETAANNAFVEQLNALQDQLNEQYDGKASVTSYGGIPIAVANAQQIKKDIQYTVGISVIVLLIVFIFFYKKATIPFILFTPTIFGALLALSFLAVFRGEISAISLGIGSVLLGVTLDYSLHILTHIRNGATPQALYKAVVNPMLMSSCSTALAFLCLLFIDSTALQDLGIFAAISVLGASLFALVFIPQVYNTKTKGTKTVSAIDAVSQYPFHKNKVLMGGLILVFIASFFTFQNVQFNKDLSRLNYIPDHLEKAEKELDALINTQAKSVYVVATGENMETALVANDAIFQKLTTLAQQQKVIQFTNIGGVIPSENLQVEKIDRWTNFWTQTRVDTLQTMLDRSGAVYGFKPNSFQGFFESLHFPFEPINLETFEDIGVVPIQDFIAESDQLTTVTSIVKVSEAQVAPLKKAFATSTNAIVIDRLALNESLLGSLKEQFNRLILYSFLAVLVLLFACYRNLKLTLVTVVPIVLTWFITMGVMGVFGLEFNVFNIMIATFIFGLGVDYNIFMTNGLQHGKDKTQLLHSHKTSILLSVLTTILGVGVLTFAKHPALYSISVVAVVGIFTAVLISFTVQPLLYRLLIFKGKKKGTS